jgi:hypothetical protein
MLNIGVQLTTCLPTDEEPVSTVADVFIEVRVYSVTPTVPLIVVEGPDEYASVLAVIESEPVTKFVEIALVVQVRISAPQRVSLTVTAPNSTVRVSENSGLSMRSKCALVGTVMDSPAVLGSMIIYNVVVVGKVA